MADREQEWLPLMHAANAGDAAAYAALLRSVAAALRPFVRGLLTRSGRAEAEVEDVVQEVLLAIHLKRHTWDPARPVAPWVYAIARYKLIDLLRRSKGRATVPIGDFAETLAADEDDRHEAGRDIARGLERLPKGQKLVVRAIAVEGASIGEAADKLNMTPGAVRVALHRGLATLARIFG